MRSSGTNKIVPIQSYKLLKTEHNFDSVTAIEAHTAPPYLSGLKGGGF